MCVYNRIGRSTIESRRVVDVSTVPEPWASRLVERGFTDGRSRQRIPSMGALSTKTGLHTSTISALISGKRKPTVETVQLLVRELGGDVAAWLGVPVRDEYTPPPEAALLTPRQRKAVDELIRSIVADEQKELMGNAEHPAPTSTTGSGSTQPDYSLGARNTGRRPRNVEDDDLAPDPEGPEEGA